MNIETILTSILGIATIIAVIVGQVADNEILLLTGAVGAACTVTIGVNALVLKRELKKEIKEIKEEIRNLHKSLKAD